MVKSSIVWRYVLSSPRYFCHNLTIFYTARNLPCHVHKINHLSNTGLLKIEYQFPRIIPRSFHTDPNTKQSQAFPTPNSESHRASYVSGLPREDGRYNGPLHNLMSTCLPLRLSRKVARYRLPRLQTYQSLSSTRLSKFFRSLRS